MHNALAKTEESNIPGQGNPQLRCLSAIRICLFITTLTGVSPTLFAGQPAPAAFNGYTELKHVGTGSIRWLGFTIYEAGLWTANGNFNGLTGSLPMALHITYRKNIKSGALAERTAREWERLSIYSLDKRKEWQQRLAMIWPSVQPGDSITTLVTADKQTHFYFNNELIQTIKDTEFGIALLSIWLHPNTSQPELRSRLIGRMEG